MKKPTLLSLFLSFLLIVGFSFASHAQTNNQFQEEDEPSAARSNRSDILQELDLSRQQLNQIRIINQQFRPPVRQSNLRMQAANRALDEAIYGDQADEALIQSKLRDAQAAHAEWIKNRTKLESEIAKTLSSSQLARFREFRQQNKQNNLRNRQLNDQAQPAPQRLNRIQRQIRNRRIQRP